MKIAVERQLRANKFRGEVQAIRDRMLQLDNGPQDSNPALGSVEVYDAHLGGDWKESFRLRGVLTSTGLHARVIQKKLIGAHQSTLFGIETSGDSETYRKSGAKGQWSLVDDLNSGISTMTTAFGSFTVDNTLDLGLILGTGESTSEVDFDFTEGGIQVGGSWLAYDSQ